MFNILQNLRFWVITSLFCLTITWSFPIQANINIDSKLEQQVLEIIRQNPKAIIESVQIYQQEEEEKVKKQRQSFLDDFRRDPQRIIGNSPTSGAKQSKTVLLEFSDFECPYCGEAQKTLENLLEKYGDKFTLVYKNFPLYQIHPQALPAAKAAYAAQKQGKFWEYHDALFTNQKKLSEGLYLEVAENLDLDLEQFQRDRNLADAAIQKDLELANKIGLSGTPSFIISGENIIGPVNLSEIENILAVE
ncbi:MAG: thioredoxin domain-containing protein [Sphaerospermopsis sp. SIO1G1]|nr:thioredoxin domain-containing protein [Sphaerospermopsis sp. SIO1G1]